MIKTHEGASTHEHSLDHHIEFFSKAGSLFTKRKSFYAGDESALSLFQKCWIVDKEKAMKLLFWLRDCRGGSGNRSGFRECLKWVAENHSAWVQENLPLITETGRWDDLKSLFQTPCEKNAFSAWANALIEGDGLAAKWASRKKDAIPLRKYMKMAPKAFRQLLSKNTDVVESKMCAGQWNEIEYQKVPSKAMAMYTKAFGKHDPKGFEAFKTKVEKGEAEIKASVLFPHDCVRTALHGDPKTADLQFNALPNFLEDTDQRIMCVCDTSGSMSTEISGVVQAVHISQGLSLYCSDRLGPDNPFYRKFIQFCSESKLANWVEHKSFSDALHDGNIFDGAVGSTRIDKALNTILNYAQTFKATNDQMPNVLLIISDMQFSGQGVEDYDRTIVKECIQKWIDAGYEAPKIVYWNTAGYAGSPDVVDATNVGLVSGFSPAILKAVFGGQDFTPIAIMERAIEKYKITIPA